MQIFMIAECLKMVHVVFVFLVVFVFKIDKKYYLQVCFRRIQVAYQRKKKIE